MHRNDGCGKPSGRAVPTERNRWFTGRFLTARDLTDEQDYVLGRHRLHNRLFHGSGVVCGLEVRPNERPECEHEWVWVDSGIAVDCIGREIIVPTREAVHWPTDPKLLSGVDAVAVLCVRHVECHTEPQSVIVADCADGGSTEPSRIVDAWKFEVHLVTDDPDDCWAELIRPGDRPTAHDCDETVPSEPGCLDPACLCSECVAIALLRRCKGGPIRVDVDEQGAARVVKRLLPPPASNLTHITETSWKHGAELGIDQLDAGGNELRVTFDRAIKPGDDRRWGVNPFTFVVEVEDSTGNRERLPPDLGAPPQVVDERVAVFTIDRRWLHRAYGLSSKLVGDVVFVTLYGDLIHDYRGLPVDADFFGVFPTGNGVKGGVFRSWFFVGSKEDDK